MLSRFVALSLAYHQLYVVGWDVTVTVEDQDRALAELRQMARGLDSPPVMVVVLGAALHPPSIEVRKKGLEMIRSALKLALALEVAATGRGVLGTLQRSTARGVALMMLELRGRVHGHDSLGKAVGHAGTLTPIDEGGVVSALARAGFAV